MNIRDILTSNKLFWGILFLAVLTRIILIIQYPYIILHVDSRLYLQEGHNILLFGKSLETFRTLGYPLVLSIIAFVFHEFLALVVFQMILGIGLSIIYYKIFLQIFPASKDFANILFLILSLSTLSINYEMTLMPELLFTFMMGLITLIIMYTAKKQSIYYFIYLGLFSGIMSIIKPTGLYFIFIGILASIFIYYKSDRRINRILLSSLMFYIFFLIPLFIHLIFNYYHHNKFKLTNQDSSQLFATSGQFVNLKSQENHEIKKIIAPYIKRYRTSNKLNMDWLIYPHDDGPYQKMMDYAKTKENYLKICKELAVEGIITHPFEFSYNKFFMLLKNLFMSLETTNKFHTKDKIFIYSSFSRLQFAQTIKAKSINLNYFDYHKFYPHNIRSHLDNQFVNPFESPGAFIRFLLTISLTRVIPLWSVGFILSFYILYMKYKHFKYISPISILYIICFVHIGIHAIMTIPSSRNILPVLNIMIFLTISGLSVWRDNRRLSN